MNSFKKHVWFYSLLGLMFFSSCEQRSISIYPHTRVIQLGDDMAWAQPTYDDSEWNGMGSTDEIGQFWVRFDIQFDERIHQLNYKGIHMISLGSYEAYWDGIKIYENGKIAANKENEVEGQFISQMLIPDSLCQMGNHVLALRLSNYHNSPNTSWSWNTFKVEEFQYSTKKELQVTAFMFVLGGCFLLVALYYFLLFIKEKREHATLVFSLICLLFFVLILFEYLKFYWSYPYTFHNSRLLIIGSLTATISFVVPLFLCLHLNIPKRKFILIPLIILIIIVGYVYNIKFDTTAMLLSSIMVFSSIILSLYACWLKRKGSLLILLAFITVAAINYFSTYDVGILLFNYDINLFLSFLILVLSILYSLSQQRKEQQEAYQASLLLSERLKNELLKKNIQPHFIMNTLTSIMEWVERSPQKSIKFIEALASEFDLLNDISDEKLIPIFQEINLCKKHLEIMSFRKEMTYDWEDKNIDPAHMIPPAILHTLVENGITHSKAPDNGKIKFILSREDRNNEIVYRMEVIAKNRERRTSSGKGTGLKYIKSRLTESYGNRWKLQSDVSTKGWLTEISLPSVK